MKRILLGVAAAALLLIGAGTVKADPPFHGHGYSGGHGYAGHAYSGGHGYGQHSYGGLGVTVVAPAPVYVAPPPVYAAPAYAAPAPVYSPGYVVPSYGLGYYAAPRHHHH